MRIAFNILFASISLSSLLACSAGESSTSPAAGSDVSRDADSDPTADAAAPAEKDGTEAVVGTRCVFSTECPVIVCPKCPQAELQECTGAHVCATEQTLCADVTCDTTDGG